MEIACISEKYGVWWTETMGAESPEGPAPRGRRRYSSDSAVAVELAALGWEPAGEWRLSVPFGGLRWAELRRARW